MDENTKVFVLDASYVLAFLLPDEHHEEVEQYFTQFENGIITFIASPILTFEIANTLAVAVLRKRITKQTAQAQLYEYLRYHIALKEIDIQEVLQLAYENNLSSYDASYVWLARKYNTQLLTLDKKLEAAMQK